MGRPSRNRSARSTDPGFGAPGNGRPVARRVKLRIPSQPARYAARSTVPSASVTRTSPASCSMPVASADQRISAPSPVAQPASSASIWLCGMSSR
jgi:hypothetical protein